MTEEHDERNQWEPCSGGEISGMLRGVHQKRRNAIVLQVAAGAVAAVALGVLFVELQPAGPVAARSLTCREVKNAARDFLAGRVSADRKERIEAHLDDCPPCEKMVRRLRNKSDRGSQLESRSAQTVSMVPPIGRRADRATRASDF